MAMSQDPPHVLIVVGGYYKHIAQEMLMGAAAALKEAGATFDMMEAPGAFEIPAAIAHADRASNRPVGRAYNGYVALGCVIRGETTHYDYVCSESARALMNLTLDPGLAIGYGILTVENEAQALERAKISHKNKGGEAARACIAMITMKRRLMTGA